MHQVFSNLVGNAIKFSPPGGAISVEAITRTDVVEFQVADTGPGIAPEVLPHLFERFRRTSKPREGIGLGLSIVKGLVHAHGGTVTATNGPTGGAVISFTLPRVPDLEEPKG